MQAQHDYNGHAGKHTFINEVHEWWLILSHQINICMSEEYKVAFAIYDPVSNFTKHC